MSEEATPQAIFADPSMQAEFDRNGYTTRSILTREQADQLRALVERFDTRTDTQIAAYFPQARTYHATPLDSDEAQKRAIMHLTQEWFEGPLNELIRGYRIITSSLFVKPPGGGQIPVHSDWTLQEDLERPTVYVWCALDDVTSDNGPLRLVEGTHGLLKSIQGPSIPPACPALPIIKSKAKPIPVEAGTAIFFDSEMLHCSDDNLTDTARYAIRIACIPIDRAGVIHRPSADDPESIETWQMDVEDYFVHSGEDLLSGNFKTRLLRTRKSKMRMLNAEQLAVLFDHADEIRSGAATPEELLESSPAPTQAETPEQTTEAMPARRSFVSRLKRKIARELRALRSSPNNAEDSQTHPETDFTPYPKLTIERQLLSDLKADHALRQRGFATFPFLSEDDIAELAERIDGAAETLDRSDVHINTRFQLSAFNNDAAYKERIFDAVWGLLKDKIGTLLPGYEPLVVNVFDKPPSEAYDPVPIHQNPSFVEEPEHKSVSLWIPLCDVNKDNGTVGLLPGSHNRFNRMRAGNMEHKDVFAKVDRRLENDAFVPVEMKRGEMLALDDSILHWSYPNVSDTRRLAVQLIMVPSDAKHIYYFYDEETDGHPMMDLYEVDRNFFFGFNCKARPETLKHIDRVPYRYRPFTEEEVFGESAL